MRYGYILSKAINCDYNTAKKQLSFPTYLSSVVSQKIKTVGVRGDIKSSLEIIGASRTGGPGTDYKVVNCATASVCSYPELCSIANHFKPCRAYLISGAPPKFRDSLVVNKYEKTGE